MFCNLELPFYVFPLEYVFKITTQFFKGNGIFIYKRILRVKYVIKQLIIS